MKWRQHVGQSSTATVKSAIALIPAPRTTRTVRQTGWRHPSQRSQCNELESAAYSQESAEMRPKSLAWPHARAFAVTIELSEKTLTLDSLTSSPSPGVRGERRAESGF